MRVEESTIANEVLKELGENEVLTKEQWEKRMKKQGYNKLILITWNWDMPEPKKKVPFKPEE